MDGTILLADDDRAITAALSAALETLGHSVIACEDIESAQLIAENVPLAAVVTDIRFTGAFGFEGLNFLEHVAANQPSAPVILMTGEASPELRIEAQSRGAHALLQKPFAIGELQDALSAAGCSPPGSPSHARRVPGFEELLSTSVPFPVFQPLFARSPSGLRLIGHEALTRLGTGTLFDNPERLFQYAERKGRLADLEAVCFGNAIREGATLSRDGLLLINVHPSVFSGSLAFAEALLAASRTHDVATDRIVVEITEQSSLGSAAHGLHNADLLRAAGVRLAFDDVGDAYSHLLHIEQFRPSFLKISHQFGAGIENEPYKRRIVRNIQSLAHDFGADVILEGIESSAGLNAALDIGISLFQGFYLGRPQTTSEIERGALRPTTLRPVDSPPVP